MKEQEKSQWIWCIWKWIRHKYLWSPSFSVFLPEAHNFSPRSSLLYLKYFSGFPGLLLMPYSAPSLWSDYHLHWESLFLKFFRKSVQTALCPWPGGLRQSSISHTEWCPERACWVNGLYHQSFPHMACIAKPLWLVAALTRGHSLTPVHCTWLCQQSLCVLCLCLKTALGING